MKVKDAIRMLNDYYSPDDELFFAWWDKDSAESISGNPLTDLEWRDIQDYLDECGELFHDMHLAIQQARFELETGN